MAEPKRHRDVPKERVLEGPLPLLFATPMLLLPKVGVVATGRQQLAMTAALDNTAAVHHQNAIGIAHGGQAMGYHECRAIENANVLEGIPADCHDVGELA